MIKANFENSNLFSLSEHEVSCSSNGTYDYKFGKGTHGVILINEIVKREIVETVSLEMSSAKDLLNKTNFENSNLFSISEHEVSCSSNGTYDYKFSKGTHGVID